MKTKLHNEQEQLPTTEITAGKEKIKSSEKKYFIEGTMYSTYFFTEFPILLSLSLCGL